MNEFRDEERKAAKTALYHLYRAAGPSAGVRYYVKHFEYNWMDEMDTALNRIFMVRDALEKRFKK